jgi:uncharacterized OB-fold protein
LKEEMPNSSRELPGLAVSSEDMQSGKYSFEDYRALLKYSWTSGVAIGRFLDGLKHAELWGRRCKRCGRTMIPPRMYCELCYRPTDEWVRLKDTGAVNTYSICWVNSDASRRKKPILIAVIEIDGASEMMGILHYLGEVRPEDVSVGMRVQAVWKKKAERTGSILDIKYFRPRGV